jgi:hypothetical protein
MKRAACPDGGPRDSYTSEVDEVDQSLSRAWEISEDLSDETDLELEDLLPPLVTAGYVEISGESESGYFWAFTPEGVKRIEALGLDSDD